MSDLEKARNREHIENHVRRVEQQILDALLRIEELLTPPKQQTIEATRAEALVINKEPGGVTLVDKPKRRFK